MQRIQAAQEMFDFFENHPEKDVILQHGTKCQFGKNNEGYPSRY